MKASPNKHFFKYCIKDFLLNKSIAGVFPFHDIAVDEVFQIPPDALALGFHKLRIIAGLDELRTHRDFQTKPLLCIVDKDTSIPPFIQIKYWCDYWNCIVFIH